MHFPSNRYRNGVLSTLSIILLCGCASTPPREWIVRFAPGDVGLERNDSRPGVENDWERIGTRIVSGSSCDETPRSEADIPGPDERGYDLSQTLRPGEMPEQMDLELAPGEYTVMAWAVDEHESLYAWSCLAVTSPGAGLIISELRSTPAPISLRAEWRVRFDVDSTATSTDRVYVRSQAGACPSEPPRRQDDDRLVVVPDGGEWSELVTLANAEPTAFMAWVEDDAGCSIRAFGCVDGPGPPVIETVMSDLEPAIPFCGDPRNCRRGDDGLACDHLVIDEIAMGNASTCFRSSDNEVFCEGSIEGMPMVMPSGFVPIEIFSRRARRTTVVGALDRGDGYCALDESRALVCWGDAFPFSDAILPQPTRIESDALPAVSGQVIISVSMGLRVGCVLLGADSSIGTTYCRGVDGDPLRDVLAGGEPEADGWALAEVGVNMLAGGTMSTCVSNGTQSTCFGDERADVSTPNYELHVLPLQFPDDETMEIIAVGEMHACALAYDHLVHCWGSDFWGALEPRFEIGSLPPACDGLNYVEMVERPDCAGYALGALYDQAHGPLSYRDSYDEAFDRVPSFPLRSPPAPCNRTQDVDRPDYFDCALEVDGNPLQVSDLTVGAFHTCGVSENAAPVHPDDVPGRVLCWGDGYELQIGGLAEFGEIYTHGTAAWVRPCDEEFAADRDAFLEGIVEIEAGTNRTCALDGRGDVFCWGRGVGPERWCAVRPDNLPLVRDEASL